MDANTWILANFKLAETEQASPWFTIEDQGGATTQFDAGAECLNQECLPSNWTGSEDDWKRYSDFLKQHYSGQTWQEILTHLMKDDTIPVMMSGHIQMVCKGPHGVHRPCEAWVLRNCRFGRN